MKMKLIKIQTLIIAALALLGCNDDFLEKYPKDSVNEHTFWKTENDLKVYNNNLYYLAGSSYSYKFMLGFTNSAWHSGYAGMFWEDCLSDNMAPKHSSLDRYAKVAAGIHVVPDGRQQGGWYWDFLRTCNIFLENYQKADVSNAIKSAYAGEVRLWRAWFYWDKVKKFGDVPWVSKSLDIDSKELFGARDDRSVVMDSVLVDLNYAVDNMSEEWYSEQPDRLNRWTALALKARICLHEGTFRKYHGLSDAEKFLSAAAEAAEEVIDRGPYVIYQSTDPAPQADYASLFTQFDLTGHKEIILFRKYITGTLGHRFNGYYSKKNGATKSLVEDYLCTDGLPVGLSTVYEGDATIEDEFKNRDPRLGQSVVIPGTVGPFEGLSKWWNTHPQPVLVGQYSSHLSNTTGYQLAKFFKAENYSKGYGKEDLDAPVIRYAEVLLAFAEAKAELGTITQADLDKSINVLRDRVAMPHLAVNPPMDPKYAGEGLSSIIVEVRRERRVELAFEGYRYDDLMRWKKGSYLAKKVLGMRLEDDQMERFEGASVVRTEVEGKKYIDVYEGSALADRQFNEAKHYLWPIPLSVISKNPELGQNPGW
ncbi:RagB/SusD family nutrient uptake outer membrane protein [Puteibacter caeruleilacunae]|nr:RagB/SusD family nutrient uptake outer membrane protein [Puteibacter caeruleilacunae]